MRSSFAFFGIFLLIQTTQAQELKLKPGQHFAYETLLETQRPLGAYLYHDINYSLLDFEVLSHTDDQYELLVLIRRKMSYHNHGYYDGDIISDTQIQKPSEPNNAVLVVDHVLSQVPFLLSIDKKGRLIHIYLDAVKNEVLKEIKTVSTNKFAQPAEEQIQNILNEKYFFRNYVFDVFQTGLSSASFEQKKDTLYQRKGKELYFSFHSGKRDTIMDRTDDTVKVSRFLNRHNRFGLTEFYRKDSLITGTYIQGQKPHLNTQENQVVLIDSHSAKQNIGTSLLNQFKTRAAYDDYFSVRKSVFREVATDIHYYLENKGELNLHQYLLHRLDSLDRLMPKNDFGYLALKAQLVCWIDYEHYDALIDKVPVDYLTTPVDLIRKAKISYQKGDIDIYLSALHVLFTKFAAGTKYPQNIHELALFIDTELAKEIKGTEDIVTLQQIATSFNAIKKMNIPALTEMFSGVMNWTNVKLARTKDELTVLAGEEFNSRYVNTGRYRLTIYDILKKKGGADSAALAYLDLTISALDNEIAQSNLVGHDATEDIIWNISAPERRTIARKYLADAWYLKSRLDKKHELPYLQIAADYCPDQEDQKNLNFIETENEFFRSRDYRQIYFDKVKAAGKAEDALASYVDMVIMEPERYNRLKAMYKLKYPNGDFKTFFSSTLQKKLPIAPAFELTTSTGKIVSSKAYSGKLVFIDFWGTWCGACVGEILKIQDAYQSDLMPKRLIVNTIACFDKLEWVNKFMTSKNYSFPVLLSDGQVEKNFNITSYPTKILILPNGHYLIVPYQEDYTIFLKQYLNWDM